MFDEQFDVARAITSPVNGTGKAEGNRNLYKATTRGTVIKCTMPSDCCTYCVVADMMLINGDGMPLAASCVLQRYVIPRVEVPGPVPQTLLEPILPPHRKAVCRRFVMFQSLACQFCSAWQRKSLRGRYTLSPEQKEKHTTGG